MAIDSIRAVFMKIDPNKREHSFEVFIINLKLDFRAWFYDWWKFQTVAYWDKYKSVFRVK